MVNPGAFIGSRKTFLLSLKQYYATAVNEGYAPEAISSIQRRYFKRYPIELPHDEEPSEEHLAAVDDDKADPEPDCPDADALTVEEYTEALKKWEDRQKLVIFRKAQIKRWFAYQFMKDSDLDSTQSGLFNPYRALLAQLTGRKLNAPRLRTPANTWRKTKREAIEEEVRRRVAANKDTPVEEGKKKESLITLRDRVAREMFKELDKDEQAEWKKQAAQDHTEAVKAWKAEMEAKPATDPKSRQIAIQGLVKFIQPVLDLVCDATGWKASFIAGGPEPAEGGLLNILSVHSGTTSGDVKMNFGRSERLRFRKTVVPMYGKFLQNCFTPVECRSRALPKEEGFLPMAELDLENDGASVDLVSTLSALPPPIPLRGASGPARTTSTLPVDRAATSAAPAAPAALTAPTSANPPAAVPSTTSTPPTVPSATNSSTLDPAAQPTRPPSSAAPSAATASANTPGVTSATVPLPPPVVPNSGGSENGATASAKGQGVSEMEVDQEGLGGGESDVEGQNPFPFDIPGEYSPRPTRTQGMSRDPSPVPSLCPSPRPSPPPPPPPARCATPQPEEASETAAPVTSKGPGGQPVTKTAGARRSKRNTSTVAAATSAQPAGARKGGKKRKSPDSENNAPAPSAVSAAGPVSKKARTRNPNKPTPSSGDKGFEVPDEAPKWFKKAFAMLSSTELGPEWMGTVEAWGRFESAAKYTEILNLGSEDRPVVIKDWIQRARSHTWRPKIVDIAGYEAQFMRWWVGLQPKWRVSDHGTLLTSSDGDWEAIRRPGVNGLLSVAAGLFFWGLVLKDLGLDTIQWLATVEDLRLVLSSLAV